jgi:uncharacterized lipoprotein YmbA
MLFAALAGCASSPPMHYYTLTSAPASTRLTTVSNNTPIRLDRVTIPSELDRAQLVRRVDSTRLQIVENDRWAAPLEDTIRRVLSDDLASRLPADLVASPLEPSVGEKRQSLSVDIEDFYGDANCTITLRAAWVLKQPDANSQALRGSVEAQVPGASPCTPASIPPAMSQALGQLSDRIAAALAH